MAGRPIEEQLKDVKRRRAEIAAAIAADDLRISRLGAARAAAENPMHRKRLAELAVEDTALEAKQEALEAEKSEYRSAVARPAPKKADMPDDAKREDMKAMFRAKELTDEGGGRGSLSLSEPEKILQEFCRQATIYHPDKLSPDVKKALQAAANKVSKAKVNFEVGTQRLEQIFKRSRSKEDFETWLRRHPDYSKAYAAAEKEVRDATAALNALKNRAILDYQTNMLENLEIPVIRGVHLKDRAQLCELIKRDEGGFKPETYPDSAEKPTVGIGFNLERPGAKEIIESIGLNYDEVLVKRQLLTEAQGDRLFEYCINEYIEIVTTKIGVDLFNSFTANQQAALINLAYTGTGLIGPVLIPLLKARDFKGVAKHLRDGGCNARRDEGVQKRQNRLADLFEKDLPPAPATKGLPSAPPGGGAGGAASTGSSASDSPAIPDADTGVTTDERISALPGSLQSLVGWVGARPPEAGGIAGERIVRVSSDSLHLGSGGFLPKAGGRISPVTASAALEAGGVDSTDKESVELKKLFLQLQIGQGSSEAHAGAGAGSMARVIELVDLPWFLLGLGSGQRPAEEGRADAGSVDSPSPAPDRGAASPATGSVASETGSVDSESLTWHKKLNDSRGNNKSGKDKEDESSGCTIM